MNLQFYLFLAQENNGKHLLNMYFFFLLLYSWISWEMPWLNDQCMLECLQPWASLGQMTGKFSLSIFQGKLKAAKALC